MDSRSRVQFLVTRNELYTLNLSQDNEQLIYTILRNYTGVFSDDVYIDEGMLSTILGKSRNDIYEMLTQLSKSRHIKYVPQKKTPYIIFSTSREDTPYVSIPKAVKRELTL